MIRIPKAAAQSTTGPDRQENAAQKGEALCYVYCIRDRRTRVTVRQENSMKNLPENPKSLLPRRYKIILIFVWAAVLIFCFINRARFTVDGVLEYTPHNTIFAVAFMLFLFALKSLSVFIFSGILFAANGILFSLPMAVGLNVVGAGIMVSLPYWLGKRLGKDIIDTIVCKYPKADILRQLRTEHEFLVSLITRTVNILPSDILSLYMGATGITYWKYLTGSISGMLLSIITFPIMGMSISTPGSPAFIVSIAVQFIVSVLSIGGCWLYLRKRAGKDTRKP